MLRIYRVALVLLVLALSLPVTVQSAVGYTPGSFKVSDSGGATYTIPIAVPPGTAGIQPNLSLTYNSQGGNGLLGMGWSLSGLSAITRCPKTYATDGASGGVDLTASDRFCLDGQRLILVGGSYGAANSEYRTERDTLSKIIANGAAGTGPQSFTVWTKSGQIIQYGTTTDARIEATGKTTVLIWAVNKIQDTAGNYLTVAYTENTTTGEYYPARLDYTGNTAHGVLPYSSVQFSYAARTDTSKAYVGGSMVSTTVRMTNAKVYEGSSLVRDYQLAYQYGATTGLSRLTSLTECSISCLPPTTFAWQEGTAGFTFSGYTYAAGVSGTTSSDWYTYAQSMDVNGDGKQDLAYCPGETLTWRINFSNGSAFSATTDSGIACTGFRYARQIDYNSDGMTDLLVPFANGVWYLMRSTGVGFATPVSTATVDSGKAVNPQVMDVNGDGRMDLVQYYNSKLYINLGTGTGFQLAIASSVACSSKHLRQVDYNADGMTDLLCPRSTVKPTTYAYWVVLKSTGSNFSDTGIKLYSYFDSTSTTPYLYLLDANGDGKADAFTPNDYSQENTSYDWKLVLNIGGAFNSAWEAYGYLTGNCGSSPYCLAREVFSGDARIVVDYNSDGRGDPLYAAKDGYWHVLQSTSASGEFTDISTGVSKGNYSGNTQVLDANGDGLADMALPGYFFNGAWNVQLRNGNKPDLLISATNGLGAQAAITYKPLTDSTVYAKGSSATFPQQDFQGPIYVVSQYTTSDGIGGDYPVTYSYAGAQIDLQGRGFLGFSMVTSTDARTNLVTETSYSQTWPYIGMPNTVYRKYNGKILGSTTNTFANKRYGAANAYYYFPYVSRSVESSYELPGDSGNLVSTVTTDNAYHASCASYDYYCDLTTIAVTSTAGSSAFARTTTNTYDTPNTSSWLLGRLSNAKVTSSTPSGATQTRESSFTYDPTTGLLLTEVVEPNGNIGTVTNIKQTTTYTYDGFGNKSGATVSGADGISRASTTSYTTAVPAGAVSGRFQYQTVNALNQSETHEYDARFGTVSKLTGPNGLATSWSYDSFGRKTLETRADGTSTTWSYALCSTGCPAYAKYAVTQTTTGAPTVTVYYDLLDREVRTETQGYNGTAIYKDTVYNGLGQIAKVSRPYYANEVPYWSYYAYDALGRVTSESLPTQASSAGSLLASSAYNGLATTVTAYRDGAALATTQVKDALGQLISVTDADSKTTAYQYDPFGNLIQVTDPANNSIQMSYDIRGRKTIMDDPDMGHWEYAYNSVGELVWQKDAKDQIATMTYDALGRMKTRSEPEGASTWTYDDTTLSGTKAIGKPSKVTWPGGDSRTFTYDSYGRPQTETTTLSGVNFAISNSYDSASRLDTVTYPQGFKVQNTYDARGYLLEVRDPVTTTMKYWSLPIYTADGQVTAFTLGNNQTTVNQYDPATGRIVGISTGAGAGSATQYLTYSYDTLGNLKDRHDYNQNNLTESFSYDNLNRMTAATIAGVGAVNVAYDPLGTGNIASKSDVGAYVYDPLHKHAVKTAGSGSYTYDANGNQLTGPNGRSISYTSYNQPLVITQNGKTIGYSYDADHARITASDADGSTLYIHPRIDKGGHYERITKADGTIEHKSYIYAGKDVIAISTVRSTGVNDTRYLHKDHLGSIDVITDETGAVKERLSYDAWGKRRNSTWSAATGTLTSLVTHHGYTGHEMLDDVGLINMNGRVYDPLLGRFLQADPTVQSPGNPQTLNRYSYAGNNPLSYTDPSGYNIFSSLWKAIKGIVKVVATVVAVVVAVWWLGPAVALQMGFAHGTLGFAVASGIVGGFAAGFATTYIMTGDLRAALYGGMTGAIMGGIGGYTSTWGNGIGGTISKVVAKSVGGGVSSVLQGGKFEYGFKMTVFNESMNVVYQRLAEMTDKLGQAAADGKQMPRDGFGSVNTDGTTRVVDRLGRFIQEGSKSLFSKLGITMSPQADPNSHWYKNIPFAAEAINAVSKVHDAMNSINYSSSTGGYITRGTGFDTAFDVYNFAGMLPAAAFTAVAAPVQVQGGGVMLALELEYHRRN